MTTFSLAHLTVLKLAPPEMIALAARTGFDAVGLRLIAVTPDTPGYDLMTDKDLMRETRRRMAATGVRVSDIEFVRITPEIDVSAHLPFLEAGAELGARHVVVAPYDPDLHRMSARIAELCERAAPFGLTIDLEFFPWTVVPNLATAVAVIDRADRPNAGILVDALHFDRSDSTLDALAAVPAHRLNFVHVCDAAGGKLETDEALILTAREDRLPPGDGVIDLPRFLAHLPPAIPVGVEVPMRGMADIAQYDALARRCRAGAGRAVDAARSARAPDGDPNASPSRSLSDDARRG